MDSIVMAALLGVSIFGMVAGVRAQTKQPRFPDLKREEMTDTQKRIYDAIAGGPRGRVRGPFGPMLRSPELTDRVQKVGEYLRFNSSLPARLNEFAILINARFWDAKYEWHAHRPLAIKGGLAESIADDLAQGQATGEHEAGRGTGLRLLHDPAPAAFRRRRAVQAGGGGVRRAGRDRSGCGQRLLHAGVDGAERGRDSAASGRENAVVRRMRKLAFQSCRLLSHK